MKIIISFFLLLTACSTYTPRTCQQRAWEAAGNAMSNVQYNLNRYNYNGPSSREAYDTTLKTCQS